MKQFNFRKGFVSMALIGAAYVSGAQIQPLSFAAGANGKTNWYANYVGVNFSVTAPSIIAGDKLYTTSNDGTGAANANNWGGIVTTPMINIVAVRPTGVDSTDSAACTTLSNSMLGKIAVVWRGPISAPCDFSQKALNVQDQGAVACVLVDEYPGAPIIPGAGTGSASVTIPVFMVSMADGQAIYSQLDSGHTVTMTISPWGQNLTHDLGIIAQGESGFPAYAMPYNQLSSSNGNPTQYKNVDGAFIANFGTSTETNAKLVSSLQWTPTGGSAMAVRSDSAILTTPFTVADSIFTLYDSDAYDLHATQEGRFDLSYALSADATDGYTGNNTATTSMYVTNNTWSKGTYDFTNNVPVSNIWYGPTSATETWGSFYYVNNGGYQVNSVQASFATSTTGTTVFSTNDQFTFYIFTWKDNVIPDGIIEAGELNLVGYTTYLANGTTDSSEGVMTVPMSYTDPANPGGTETPVILNDTTWYWVSALVESGGNDDNFLGCDGVNDDYPRSYGRYHQRINSTTPPDSTYIEPYGTSWADDGVSILSEDPDGASGNFPFDNRTDVDSITYSNQRGLIPSVAMITSQFPASVKNVTNAGYTFTIGIYPNPSDETNIVNVNVSLTQPAKTIKYIVLDPLGRVVANISHTNVQTADKLVIPTDKLAAGGYYVSVIVDGKNLTEKFVVTK